MAAPPSCLLAGSLFSMQNRDMGASCSDSNLCDGTLARERRTLDTQYVSPHSAPPIGHTCSSNLYLASYSYITSTTSITSARRRLTTVSDFPVSITVSHAQANAIWVPSTASCYIYDTITSRPNILLQLFSLTITFTLMFVGLLRAKPLNGTSMWRLMYRQVRSPACPIRSLCSARCTW